MLGGPSLGHGPASAFAFAGRFAVGPRVPLRAPAPSVAHPDDDHFSWNTSDFTMTGTTPLGATGAPTSM